MANEEQVIDAIKQVMDPHTGVNVYDMGLISDLKINDDIVSLTFIPTSPVCPMGLQLAKDIKDKVMGIDGISNCKVNLVGHIQADEINKYLNS
ncbi:MAG TPA: metal-sulfur cluster assembly factor [Euryarchaeota archaeon]|nr:metal-sulfur cluster assembly factor [Euryarchaeota archaeon]